MQNVRLWRVWGKQYGVDNWQQVDNAKERYFNACHRHLAGVIKPSDKTPKELLNKMAHMVLFLARRCICGISQQKPQGRDQRRKLVEIEEWL